MSSPISEPSPPLCVQMNKARLRAQLRRDLLHISADGHWSPDNCCGWEQAHLNSLLPPGSSAEDDNQMVRRETLMNNNLNACSLQQASHWQISACLVVISA